MHAAHSLWPCVPLQHSLLACRGSLWAISVVRHPPLRRILCVVDFYAVGAVLPLPRGAPVCAFCFARPDRCALVKRDNITAERWRGRGNTRLSDTGRTNSKKINLAPVLTLRHCQGDNKSSPFSHDSLIGFSGFADLAGRSREIVKSRVHPTDDGFALSLSHSLSLALSRSLALSLSRSLALSRFLSLRVFTTKMQSCQASRLLL